MKNRFHRLTSVQTSASQRNESFAYDAVGLIERYRVQRDVGGMQGSCAPDASSQPISEWRYRFGPLQEREQKRQYLSDVPAGGLAWTYTLLGADAKQLASYNGIQGAFCGQPPTTVWLWPVEYNSYGPAHTRVITRPGGASEYVLHDHLGSARITLDNAARVIESQSYTAYGDHRTHDGEASRTSYIGRETDKETDLGFFGVRLYDPTYGRFLSVDPLWGEFPQTSTYVYADNDPISKKDPSGLIWETVWDVANVVVDVARVVYHASKGNKKETNEALVDLAVDGVATLVPGVPAGLSKLRHADKAVDVVKTADKVVDASKAGKKTTEGAKQVGKGSGEHRGTIYVVPGSGTPSGKPYVGRHNKPEPQKTRSSRDGRDRSQAEVVDTYEASNTNEGRTKEQATIDANGGVKNLDNKRNEIRKPK